MNDTNQEAPSRDQQQRVDQVCELVRAQLGVFSRQGAIVATWREHQGRKLGPYYRLAWREEGRQRSRYLGVLDLGRGKGARTACAGAAGAPPRPPVATVGAHRSGGHAVE